MHEIWIEGYREIGDSAEARMLGRVDAETFAEACDKICTPAEWQKRNGSYDRQRGTVWGCRLFNNEADATGKVKNVKATIQVDLQPFKTPNFVRAVMKPGKLEDGMQEATCYPLSDLDADTLDFLCSEFRAEVFRKAGKDQPPTCG